MVGAETEKDTGNLFDYQCLSLCFGAFLPRLKWSWRESNPRPNKRLSCFLHAYSVVDCRAGSGRGHPRQTLSSKKSPAVRGVVPAIPSLRAPPGHMPTVGACGRCLVPATVAGIKPTYYASVMQQERSYFRQLNLVHRWSRLLMREPACLQIHLLAVKTSQPHEISFEFEHKKSSRMRALSCLAVRTRLELATPCVTGMYSNQTELPNRLQFKRPFLFCECKSTTFFDTDKFFFVFW